MIITGKTTASHCAWCGEITVAIFMLPNPLLAPADLVCLECGISVIRAWRQERSFETDPVIFV